MNNKLFIDRGIYNNIDVMENTLESINDAFRCNYNVKCKVQHLNDGTFILFEDNALTRLLNIKDNIKSISYDEIEYMSKYNILKLDDLLNVLDNNLVILELSNFSKKVCNIFLKKIKDYQKNIIILSKNVKVLNFFKKNGFLVMFKIGRKNKLQINSYFKPDFYCVDNGLFDRKRIKKLREDYYVLVNNVKKDEIKYALEMYDNVIIIS